MFTKLFYFICERKDHYEVNTVENEYREVKTSNCFLSKWFARRFYNSIKDEMKEFLLVDKDGYIITVLDMNY